MLPVKSIELPIFFCNFCRKLVNVNVVDDISWLEIKSDALRSNRELVVSVVSVLNLAIKVSRYFEITLVNSKIVKIGR